MSPGNTSSWAEGKPVSLSPKSFEILVALIQSNGRVLTKDELMQQVWPDNSVEEANLTLNASALRRVLSETPEGPQYIETVAKRGYRFVAPVLERQEESKPRTYTVELVHRTAARPPQR